MKTLIVAVWDIDTLRFCPDIRSRLAELDAQLTQAYPTMLELAKSDSETSYLFVAPEYLFTGTNSHFMPENDKDEILIGLAMISKKYKSLLLIPGSVGWYKTAERSRMNMQRKLEKQQNSIASVDAAAGLEASGFLGSSQVSASSSSSSVSANANKNGVAPRNLAKYIQKVENFRGSLVASTDEKTHKAKFDLFKLPEGYGGDKEYKTSYEAKFTEGYEEANDYQNRVLSSKVTGDTRTIRQRLEQNDPDVRVARNTSFVFFDGKILHKYHKIFEAFDAGDKDVQKKDQQHPILLVPGLLAAGENIPTFVHESLTYGLELCADNALGALKINTTKINVTTVDVHIIMSASIMLEEIALVGERLIIHADARQVCVRTRKEETCRTRDKAVSQVLIFKDPPQAEEGKPPQAASSSSVAK